MDVFSYSIVLGLAKELEFFRTTRKGIVEFELFARGVAIKERYYSLHGLRCVCGESTCSTCEAWRKFLKLGKCIRCAKTVEVSIESPYCRSCYELAKNETVISYHTIRTATEDDVSRRKRAEDFKWLLSIPKVVDHTEWECIFCLGASRTRISKDREVRNDVAIYGKWFRICTDCLATQYDKQMKIKSSSP
jgi:hypothetical protein